MSTTQHKASCAGQPKFSKTILEYDVQFKGWELKVPVGTVVHNKTAMGYDDHYYFLHHCREFAKKVTGHAGSTLAHDLEHYGLNIPVEYCAPYTDEQSKPPPVVIDEPAKCECLDGAAPRVTFESWLSEVNGLLSARYGLVLHAEDVRRDSFEEGDTPEVYVDWYGEKYDLTRIDK